LWTLPGWVNICYDLQFSDAALDAARDGARVLACPCNNMLLRESAEQWQWRHNQIRSIRAQEANVWLVSSERYWRKRRSHFVRPDRGDPA